MKKKIEVGSQIDINAAFDGGAVDSSVQYSVPVSMQDVITVSSAGVVSAVSEGTAVVEIKDTSGNLLRSVVFQVLSAADFAVQSDLDEGVTELSVETVEVVQAPAFTLVTGGTAFSTGHPSWATHPNGPNAAFDGNDLTSFESWESGFATRNTFIGKQFSSPKQIKRIKIKWETAPGGIAIRIQSSVNSYYLNETDWPTILTVSTVSGEQTIDLPAYTAGLGIMIYPASPFSDPDRIRIKEIEFYE